MDLPHELLLKIIESYTISTQEELILVYRQRGVSWLWFRTLEPRLEKLLGEMILNTYETLRLKTTILPGDYSFYAKFREKLYGLCTRERLAEVLPPRTPLENCYLIQKRAETKTHYSLLVEGSREIIIFSLQEIQNENRVPHFTSKGAGITLLGGEKYHTPVLSWKRLFLIPEKYFIAKSILTPIFLTSNFTFKTVLRPSKEYPEILFLKDSENCAFYFPSSGESNGLVYLQSSGKTYFIAVKEHSNLYWSELKGELLPRKEVVKFWASHRDMISLLRIVNQGGEPFYSHYRLLCPELNSLLGQPFLRRIF